MKRIAQDLGDADLSRTLKNEDVYIRGYVSLPELLLGLTEYFVFYNGERPHHSLGYRTPADVHQTGDGGGACIVDRFGDQQDPAAALAALCGRTPREQSVRIASERADKPGTARPWRVVPTLPMDGPHQRRCALRTPAAHQQQILLLIAGRMPS